jgi:hypothetical protein
VLKKFHTPLFHIIINGLYLQKSTHKIIPTLRDFEGSQINNFYNAKGKLQAESRDSQIENRAKTFEKPILHRRKLNFDTKERFSDGETLFYKQTGNSPMEKTILRSERAILRQKEAHL